MSLQVNVCVMSDHVTVSAGARSVELPGPFGTNPSGAVLPEMLCIALGETNVIDICRAQRDTATLARDHHTHLELPLCPARFDMLYTALRPEQCEAYRQARHRLLLRTLRDHLHIVDPFAA